MGSWKTVVWATGILVATGIGAEIAPPAEGQTKIARQAKPAIVQVLAGTGSWIGVSVRDVVADDVSKMKLQGPAGVVVEEVTRRESGRDGRPQGGRRHRRVRWRTRAEHAPVHASRAGDTLGTEGSSLGPPGRATRAVEHRAAGLRQRPVLRRGVSSVRKELVRAACPARSPGACRATSRPGAACTTRLSRLLRLRRADRSRKRPTGRERQRPSATARRLLRREGWRARDLGDVRLAGVQGRREGR